MKKITGIFLILLLLVSAGSLSAKVTVTITVPQVNSSVSGYNAINTALSTYNTSGSLNTDIISDLSLGTQDKLAKGFGNSVGFASRAASLDGYQGYDLFAFMAGGSIAIELPSLSADAIDQMSNDIKKDKDTDAGAGVGSAFNLGLNMSKLLGLNGNRIYFNVKYFTYSVDAGDYSFDATTFGFGLNYQLVDRGGDRFKAFKWTGISVGSGLLYNSNKIDMTLTLDREYTEAITATGGPYYIGLEPKATFGIDVTSYTIPLDISTSIRLLWIFNLTLGAGVDFMFGQSEVVMNSTTGLKVYDSSHTELATSNDGTAGTPGSVVIDAGTDGNPSLAHARLTGGLGICLGPLPIDLSATWYPIDNGAAVNVSTGIVW